MNDIDRQTIREMWLMGALIREIVKATGYCGSTIYKTTLDLPRRGSLAYPKTENPTDSGEAGVGYGMGDLGR
jgi:hypothetical protein